MIQKNHCEILRAERYQTVAGISLTTGCPPMPRDARWWPGSTAAPTAVPLLQVLRLVVLTVQQLQHLIRSRSRRVWRWSFNNGQR